MLDQKRRGSVLELVYGLLWAQEKGADIVCVNVVSASKSPHLVGITEFVARNALVIMHEPPGPAGEVYPSDPALRDLVHFVR